MSYITANIREEYDLHKEHIETLDKEWYDLIREALDAGITIEEIRDFLKNPTIPVKN